VQLRTSWSGRAGEPGQPASPLFRQAARAAAAAAAARRRLQPRPARAGARECERDGPRRALPSINVLKLAPLGPRQTPCSLSL